MPLFILFLITSVFGDSLGDDNLEFGIDYIVTCQNENQVFKFFKHFSSNEMNYYIDVTSTSPSSLDTYELSEGRNDLNSGLEIMMPHLFPKKSAFVLRIDCQKSPNDKIQFKILELKNEFNKSIFQIDEHKKEGNFTRISSWSLSRMIGYILLGILIAGPFSAIYLIFEFLKNIFNKKTITESVVMDIVAESAKDEERDTNISFEKNDEDKFDDFFLQSHKITDKKIDICVICLETKALLKYSPCNHSNSCLDCGLEFIARDHRCLT